jgi:hypothetical protein
LTRSETVFSEEVRGEIMWVGGDTFDIPSDGGTSGGTVRAVAAEESECPETSDDIKGRLMPERVRSEKRNTYPSVATPFDFDVAGAPKVGSIRTSKIGRLSQIIRVGVTSDVIGGGGAAFVGEGIRMPNDSLNRVLLTKKLMAVPTNCGWKKGVPMESIKNTG